MTRFLPDTLRTLFAARPPIEFKPPVDDLLVNRNKKRVPIHGVAEYVHLFEDPSETPMKLYVASRDEKRDQWRAEKRELWAYKLEQAIATWAPANNPDATSDPYKTLFVARINYETSECKLRREFEQFGKIHKMVMPTDKKGKPRGYAFIEYAHKEDMTKAYKKGDGLKIDGRRVVVDYERGRTTKSWLPRRLGGGKGNTRCARAPAADAHDTRSSLRDRSSHRDEADRSRSSRRGGTDRSRSSRRDETDRSRSSRDEERACWPQNRDERENRGGDKLTRAEKNHMSSSSRRPRDDKRAKSRRH